jgi:hypothetical protein
LCCTPITIYYGLQLTYEHSDWEIKYCCLYVSLVSNNTNYEFNNQLVDIFLDE